MTNPMLAELDEVVRLAEKATPGPWHRAQLANVVISESIDQWGLKQVISGRPADDWLCTAAVNFLRTHHATLADMAKRLEAAEKGVTATDFATAMHNLGLSVATYARVDHEARRIARERAATQEGEG